jgi:pimeloyl-ACP methyl ester carboxylesterase
MKTIPIQILTMLFVAFSLTARTVPVKIDLISNGNKLDAKFYAVERGVPSPTVILLHGVPGNDNNPLGLAERLSKSGINILVFNYQGTFDSEGLFNFNNCWNDIGVALDFLKQKKNIRQFSIDTSRIIICGYSLGGSLALTAAVYNPEIKNIIAIAGGTDQSVYLKKMAADPFYRTKFEQRLAGICVPKGPIKGDSIYFHHYFNRVIPDVDNYDLVKNADKLKNREILFIAGWLDITIPMEEYIIPVYRQLKNLNAQNVYIKALETDHSFGNVMDELTNSIADWIKRSSDKTTDKNGNAP